MAQRVWHGLSALVISAKSKGSLWYQSSVHNRKKTATILISFSPPSWGDTRSELLAIRLALSVIKASILRVRLLACVSATQDHYTSATGKSDFKGLRAAAIFLHLAGRGCGAAAAEERRPALPALRRNDVMSAHRVAFCHVTGRECCLDLRNPLIKTYFFNVWIQVRLEILSVMKGGRSHVCVGLSILLAKHLMNNRVG